MRFCVNMTKTTWFCLLLKCQTQVNDTGNVFGKHRTAYIMGLYSTQKFPVTTVQYFKMKENT